MTRRDATARDRGDPRRRHQAVPAPLAAARAERGRADPAGADPLRPRHGVGGARAVRPHLVGQRRRRGRGGRVPDRAGRDRRCSRSSRSCSRRRSASRPSPTRTWASSRTGGARCASRCGGSAACSASRSIGGLLVVLATLALIVPGIWLFVSYSVAVPALLLERIGPVEALRRSFRLVRGRWWPTRGGAGRRLPADRHHRRARHRGDHARPQRRWPRATRSRGRSAPSSAGPWAPCSRRPTRPRS